MALRERFGRFVYRLVPVHEPDASEIAAALQVYLGLLRRRPDVPDRTQRPFGKVRAEFDRALLAGNELDAVRLREELVGSGRVDAEQEKYLDIRMLAGLGHQFQLAHDYPLVKSVLGLSLPAQTIADLVGALYSTYIADMEDRGDDEAVLAVFRKEIAETSALCSSSGKALCTPACSRPSCSMNLCKPNRTGSVAKQSYPSIRGWRTGAGGALGKTTVGLGCLAQDRSFRIGPPGFG